MPATAVCITQTFPVAEYVGPAAASLRGATGFEIESGGNIFGAFDNGFVNVRLCSATLCNAAVSLQPH